MPISEKLFKSKLIKELEEMFSDCLVLLGDSSSIQGFPDLIILYRDTWAILECKRASHAPIRPNQKFWIDFANEHAFGRIIYPENKKEVLNELQKAFRRFG